MHGGGGDADEIFGGVEGKTDLKNILDNMIAKGDIEPLIVVAPTFYYKGTTEALTSTKAAGVLTQNFEHELLKDLIPVIENKFRVKKERENRAFGGFSMGSEATWNIFSKCLEHFKYFLPMSGDCWAIKEKGGLLATEETVKYLVSAVGTSGVTCEEYNIFACVGDDDIAYEPLNTMIEEMKQYKDTFVFADDFKNGNIIYCVAKGGIHTYDYCYQYIYNALPHFFK